MKNHSKRVCTIYTAVNLYIATTVLLVILQTTHFQAPWMALASLFMILSIFLAIPLIATILWFVNRHVRPDYTRAQRRYCISSRIIFALAWLASCPMATFCGAQVISEICGTKRTTTISQMAGGHQFIVKQVMVPGFLDPSITRKLRIRWRSGRAEDLPTTFNDVEQYASNVLEICGYVLIPAGRTLFYRLGTISSVQGPWQMWEISSSQSLHAYLRRYAKKHGDVGVKITSHIDDLHIEQRPSVVVVDPSIVITNEDIRYNSGRYFSSAIRGCYTPHLIDSVDPATLTTVMKSEEVVTSMPRVLVFAATNAPNLTWVFSESETKTKELQQSVPGYPPQGVGSPEP